MNIFITGGTGFIGRALVSALLDEGHKLTILTRQTNFNAFNVQAVKFCHSFAMLNFNQFDAIINLAGEPIFDKSWNKQRKQILTESRVRLTQQIVAKIKQCTTPPQVLISGSATGFYGDVTSLTEHSESLPVGKDFASQLCQQWEAAALDAQSSQTRVCLVRTGLVLSPYGGMLQRLLPIYRYGLGGKMGSGSQHWAWIALSDQIRAILFLLHHKNCQGAFNLVAPTLTTQAEFNRTLAHTLHRPAFCSIPALIVRVIFGERAALLLDNQPLLPQKLLAAGFQFHYPNLISALGAI